MTCRYGIPFIASLLLSSLLAIPVSRAQQQPTLDKYGKEQVSDMLHDAYTEVKKHYYDPKLHGLDWNARYEKYSALIGNVHDLGEGFRVVAAFLSGLKDSHTHFIPPARAAHFESGFRLAVVGDACFVTQVRPKTDADSKLHIGDKVASINGFDVNREDYHDLGYYLHVLVPQMPVRMSLRAPSGEEREVAVNPIVQQDKQVLELIQGPGGYDWMDYVRHIEAEEHLSRNRVVESGDVAIWKLQEFDPDVSKFERTIASVRNHRALILDLRGNHGGAVDTEEYLLGWLFGRDIKMLDRVRRDGAKPEVAKKVWPAFSGKLIVLVDGDSASASEILARIVQLEHRGTVIGDRTAGAVMESMQYVELEGVGTSAIYGFSVTDANLIMSDGKSLEKTGVVPDELLLPTGADLAAGRDPVLARAAELAGIKLDPVEAGRMFPFEWPPI
jgi:carboxyl-terminal processing protease